MRKILLFFLLLLVLPIQAQEATPEATEEVPVDDSAQNSAPLEISMGVYVIGLSEFNLEQGLYTVDYYLSLYCSRACSDEEIAIDFVGTTGTFSLNVEERYRELDFAEYRIQSVLSQNDINLSRFPFDVHHLNIILESKFLDMSEVVYITNPVDNAIDEQVHISGWQINQAFSVEIVEKIYYEQPGYARLVFSIELHRAGTAAFIRSILPALIVLVISLLSSYVPDLSQRSGIAGGILLALLLHHLSVANGIPQVAYPVYFDAFMLANNGLILLQFALTVWEIALDKRKVPLEEREKLSQRFLLGMIMAWLIAQALLFWFFLA